MKLVLPPEWVKKLQEQPESGMGYQIVTITLNDGTTHPGTVINCAELYSVRLRDTKIEDIKEIKVNGRSDDI